MGCTESGMKRQNIEGKKYSNSAWEHSNNVGIIEMKKAPGGSYKIHSSGGRIYKYIDNIPLFGKTIIEDYTNNTKKLKIPENYKNSIHYIKNTQELQVC